MDKVEITIHNEQSGNLENLISDTERMQVTHLKISGFLNVKDFDVLDDMCSSEVSFDENDTATTNFNEPPFLTILDLGDCLLTENLYLPEFTYYSKLEKIICPKNLKGMCGLEVFKNSSFLKIVEIPETFIEFGFGTFLNCELLEKIKFPEKLEKIGSFSFSGCEGLRNIKIPKNVSFIGGAAFSGCYNVAKFEIDELNPYFSIIDGVLFNKNKTKLIAFPCGYKNNHYSVPDGVTIIGDGSFLASKIVIITFPRSLQVIEGWAFRFCENLTFLHIPNSVTEIGESAFGFCSKLEKVKLSNRLTTLKRQVFGACENLKEIDIPSSIKIIENTALGWSISLETIHLHSGLEVLDDLTDCKTLKTVIIPKTVKQIASGIFRKSIAISKIKLDKENPYFSILEGLLYSKDKTKLIAVPYNEKKTIVISEGVQEIADFVFEGFEKLENIIFPNSLQAIGYRTFENCILLRKISFPKSFISIDFRTFDNCEKLEAIEIYAKKPPIITNPLADCWKFIGDAKNLTLYVPKDSLKAYQKLFGWKDIKKMESL